MIDVYSYIHINIFVIPTNIIETIMIKFNTFKGEKGTPGKPGADGQQVLIKLFNFIWRIK